jgi:hypothetical protein
MNIYDTNLFIFRQEMLRDMKLQDLHNFYLQEKMFVTVSCALV